MSSSYAVVGPGGATNNSLRRKARKLATGISKEYFEHEWARRNKTRNYSVVNSAGNLVGFALIEVKRPTMKIHLIATKPGSGIGKLLMKKIITGAKRSKIQVIFFEAVKTAIGFYEKLGFVPTGNKTNNSLTMMAKNIRPVKRTPKAPKTLYNPNLNRFLMTTKAVSNSLKKPNNLSRFLKIASEASNSLRKKAA